MTSLLGGETADTNTEIVDAAGAESTAGGATDTGAETAAGNETSADGAGAADALSGDAAGDKVDGGDDTTSGAPETYADFTMPEGVTFDAEVGDDLKAFAKQAGLTQAQAQAVADMGVKLISKHQTQSDTAMAEIRNAWADEAKRDAEIGGDKLTATLAAGRRALTAFGTPALRELLNGSGLGNHPEFIRFFAKAGQAISEDGVVTGQGGPTGVPRDAANRLFGDDKT